MNPYVFFVGCPRSGTTLLSRIGDAHPELAIIRELHWLPRWWDRRRRLTSDGMVSPELVARLRRHPRFPRLGLTPADVDALLEHGQPKHYSRFVTELFDLHGRAKGKKLVGEKTPEYVRSLGTLHSLWPHARVVHLVRDGRDVALSLLDLSRRDRWAGSFPSWEVDPVTTTALFWEWNLRLGVEASRLLGPERYYESRYERLVADPERECTRICEFLDVAYEPVMLRFHVGRMRSRRTGPQLPVTPGLRRWQEQMPTGDLARFQAAGGDLLEELGYERAAVHPTDEDLARAARLREAFVDHARSLGEEVPEAWQVQAA